MNKKITPNEQKEYFAAGCNCCQKCESDNIEAGNFDASGDQGAQGITCLDCDFEWHDQYMLIAIEAK